MRCESYGRSCHIDTKPRAKRRSQWCLDFDDGDDDDHDGDNGYDDDHDGDDGDHDDGDVMDDGNGDDIMGVWWRAEGSDCI